MRERLERSIDGMCQDPFQADVKALKGSQWKGLSPKRVGSYRIIFTADQKERVLGVAAILRRSEKTYR